MFFVAFTLLATSLTLMGKGFKRITMTFLAVGAGLLLYSESPISAWIAAALSMKNLIAIVAVLQLFAIPIEVGKYNTAVRYWLEKSVKRESTLFLFATVSTHLFSSILLFGTVPVMVSLLGDTLKHRASHYERFMSGAIIRGYALVVLWAPGAIILLLVVQAARVAWIDLLLPGLLLSLIGIITSVVLESRLSLLDSLKPETAVRTTPVISKTVARNKVYQMLIVVLSFVFLTAILEKMNFGLYAGRVLFAGFVIALVWTAAFVKRPDFRETLNNYWQRELLKTVDLVPLFFSLGIFSTAIEKAGLIALIQPGLQHSINTMGAFSMAALPVFMILCAMGGVHPYVSIVLIAKVLTSLQLPIAPVPLALCLSVGAVISFILSPFAGMVLTLAKFINCRTVDIAFRWNWIFSLIFFGEGIVFAYCWSRL
jgi:hypothetical protein